METVIEASEIPERGEDLRLGFRMGDWIVRPIEGRLDGATGSHHLQPKSMDVLLCLASSANHIVERNDLIEQVWGHTAITDEPLTRCIHEIRRELGDTRDKPTYIQTIPKRGYRLIAAVEPVGRDPGPTTLRAASSRSNVSAGGHLTAEPYDRTRAAEPFEVMMHPSEISAARDIESGDYAKGIERLLARLGNSKQPFSVRTPIVIDLCAGYTLMEDFNEATRYCDDAVAAGWYTGLALNNRGALKIAKGEYESAIDDFVGALRANGADAMAGRNLQRTLARMAAITDERNAALAQVMDS